MIKKTDSVLEALASLQPGAKLGMAEDKLTELEDEEGFDLEEAARDTGCLIEAAPGDPTIWFLKAANGNYGSE